MKDLRWSFQRRICHTDVHACTCVCVRTCVYGGKEVSGSEDKILCLRLCSALASGSVSRDSCCYCVFKLFCCCGKSPLAGVRILWP